MNNTEKNTYVKNQITQTFLELLKDIIFNIFVPRKEYPNFTAYTVAFIANRIYGWIEEWFLRGMQESGVEMTEMLKNRKL